VIEELRKVDGLLAVETSYLKEVSTCSSVTSSDAMKGTG
jgi:hypothetical protein